MMYVPTDHPIKPSLATVFSKIVFKVKYKVYCFFDPVFKEQAKARSGGKRGRPKSDTPKTVSTPKVSSGKRGRPALSAEAIRLKAADKAAIVKRSGGKRGRPKSNR